MRNSDDTPDHVCILTGHRVSRPSGEATNNSTNLALHGIVAIQAMSVISSEAGEYNDSQHYAVGVRCLLCPICRLKLVVGGSVAVRRNVEIASDLS